MNRIQSMFTSFKGVRNDEVGAQILNMPTRTLSAPKGREVGVSGGDGTLWLDDGGYEPITIRQSFEVDAEDEIAVLDWLSGSGRLTYGDMPGYYYRARVVTAGQMASILPRLDGRQISVTFTCFPFRFQVDEEALEFTEAAVFVGQGSVATRPVITVYGSGDINLMVNDSSVLLEDVDGHITLDCEAMMAFKDGVNVSPQVTLLSDVSDDEWPRLKPVGEYNEISWTDDAGDGEGTSNVTRVVVQPNWRYR